jgi:hypothetical protein
VDVSYTGAQVRDLLEYRQQPLLSLLTAVLVLINFGIVVTVIGSWHWLAAYLTEPLGWAAQMALPPRPGLLEFPAVLLWAGPLFFGVAAWLAHKAKKIKQAFGLAAFPVFYCGLIAAWYYGTPNAWH